MARDTVKPNESHSITSDPKRIARALDDIHAEAIYSEMAALNSDDFDRALRYRAESNAYARSYALIVGRDTDNVLHEIRQEARQRYNARVKRQG